SHSRILPRADLAHRDRPPFPTRRSSDLHIFQHTHSSRKPPASNRPTMASSWTVISAKLMRSTTAAARPMRIAFLRCSGARAAARSEEHTSELQSRENLVCRLLLEKKKQD